MIQANELRIGNLLKVDTNFWTVNSIITQPFELYFDQNIEYDHSLNAEPIPLTEEWLVRFGFEFDIFYQKHTNGKMCIYWCDKVCLLSWCKNHREDLLRYDYPKYVHQLQNLYFALTGEELKYSE